MGGWGGRIEDGGLRIEAAETFNAQHSTLNAQLRNGAFKGGGRSLECGEPIRQAQGMPKRICSNGVAPEMGEESN